jgi:23S rRNA pseudouridine2605 synthase
MVRIQKLLSQSGMASRREAERLIAEGEVTVDGVIVTDPSIQVDPDRVRVALRGVRVTGDTPNYRILLKPRACLSTVSAPKVAAEGEPAEKRRPSVRRYLSDAELPWKVVGPLDFPSEGVLLLTTDGDLAERLSRAKNRLPMTYHLKFQGVVGDVEIARILRGWRFEDLTVQPTAAVSLASTGKNTWVEIEVPEMRPRAIYLIGDILRRHVLKISRVKFAGISFEGLKMGEHRDLHNREITMLQAAGSAPVPKNIRETQERTRPNARPNARPRPATRAPVGDRRPAGTRAPAGDRALAGDRRPTATRAPAGDRRPTGTRAPMGDRAPARDRKPAGKRGPSDNRPKAGGARGPSKRPRNAPKRSGR